MTANDLTKQALMVLRLKGFHVWRQNNIAVRGRKNSVTPGISDILGFHKLTGRFLACEIKAGEDRLSKEQIEFLQNVKDAGGVSLVVRSINDLNEIK